jgi:hypothetical protein
LLPFEIIGSASNLVMFSPIWEPGRWLWYSSNSFWDPNCENLRARQVNPTGRRNPFVPSGISGGEFEIKEMLYSS